ncbi:MAG TPA: TonB-dependent receptor [Myxococcota bacterium]|nr:TonB-dependent receptor [Myxococcota bacterium]
MSRRSPLCLALALLVARAAGAQSPDPQASPVDEMVIRGVRTGELAGEPTAFGELIRTGDYVAERKSLADLLSEQPGVFVRRFGGAGDPAELSIRGSTSQQVAVSIDGVRANSALTGGFDLSRVCVPLVDEIELARGAGATREGSGAIGGAINLVTRSGSPEATNRVSGSGGAFDTWEGSAFRSASTSLGDRSLDYSLGYCGLRTKGDFEFARPEFEGPDGDTVSFEPSHAKRINNERTQHGATLGLGSRVGPGTLRLGEYFSYSDGGEPGIDCCNGEDAGQNPDASSTDWSNLAQLRYETDALTRAHEGLQLALYHRYEDSQYHDPLRALFGDPVDTRAGISTPGARAESAWQLQLGPVAQRLGLGLDGFRDHLDADAQPSHARATGAVRLSDEIGFWDGRALLVPALRAEKTEGFDLQWIPALGARLQPWDWLRLRANATRAYRTPDFDELYHPDQGFIRGNPDLEAEDAWSFDAGFELALAQLGPIADAQLAASWFRREIDDSIVWVQINATTIAPVNTGEATMQGVELALSFRVTDYVRVSLNHTELDSERDATSEDLPGVPKRESFARVQLGPPDLVKLVGEWQRTDDLLVAEGGGRSLPDRSVWNASLSLNLAGLRWLRLERWSNALWVYVEGNNLSDEAVRDTLAFPQPGRNLAAGFEAIW